MALILLGPKKSAMQLVDVVKNQIKGLGREPSGGISYNCVRQINRSHVKTIHLQAFELKFAQLCLKAQFPLLLDQFYGPVWLSCVVYLYDSFLNGML
jgi:hypothetical protein